MIILTGVSGGIGNGLIPYLLEIDKVIGIYNTSLPSAPANERLFYEQVNIKNSAEIKSFVKKWSEELSRVTLIHLAVLNVDGLAASYAEHDWDRVMAVNLKGNFLLTQALLPCMIRERWGRIIHISSFVGMKGRPGTIAYSVSKTGLTGMSNVLAKEYGRFNITSNILVLGYFETGLFDNLQDQTKKEIIGQIPSKTLGRVSNISNAIEFLIKSEYVNGANINIDGGI